MNIDVQLPEVWVYTLADYRQCFRYSDQNLRKGVLELPASLSSFNMQATTLGHTVVSASPLYTLDRAALKHQIDEWLEAAYLNLQMLGQQNFITPPERQRYWLLWNRIAQLYLNDYVVGKANGRYQFSGTSALPFVNQQFALALCINAEETITADFIQRVFELLRVANEVRIYPMPVAEDPDIFASLLIPLQANNIAIAFEQVPALVGAVPGTLCRMWHTHCPVER